MIRWLTVVLGLVIAGLKSRRHLLLENLALRLQLFVLCRGSKRSRLTPLDRTLWAWLITLIREMNHANPLWGAPRIHGELLKLGITLAQRTVANYMVRRARRPSSLNWHAFLRNHLGSMVSVDFLTVPTLNFQVLYAFIVLSHHRRRVLHFHVVQRPSAGWTAQQLQEAFAFTSPPKYLLRDRDDIYGLESQHRAKALGLEEVRITPRSPWSPYVERLIGSVRRHRLPTRLPNPGI